MNAQICIANAFIGMMPTKLFIQLLLGSNRCVLVRVNVYMCMSVTLSLRENRVLNT